MSPLEAVRRELADVGYTLSRAIPRAADHLLLQVVPHAGGAELAGQWFGDPERARKVAAATVNATVTAVPDAPVHRFGNVVLQGAGADRRLPELAALAREPGARLVAHRPERRGVVAHRRHGESVFSKVVRPGRATALADDLRKVAAVLAVPVPEVVAVDADRGRVTTRALPGRTLHDRLGDPDGGGMAGTVAAVGQVVDTLHRATPPEGTATHGAREEVAVVHRWLDHAARFGVPPVPAPFLHRETSRMEVLLGRPPAPAALLHRDLHDKQLLLGPDGPGVLDLDLLAVGDPGLDLANLVVHLELRARQGLLPEEAAADLARALVAAYQPADAVRATAPGYLLATRLRLAAVYAFRPASRAAAARLLTEPLMTELP